MGSNSDPLNRGAGGGAKKAGAIPTLSSRVAPLLLPVLLPQFWAVAMELCPPLTSAHAPHDARTQ